MGASHEPVARFINPGRSSTEAARLGICTITEAGGGGPQEGNGGAPQGGTPNRLMLGVALTSMVPGRRPKSVVHAGSPSTVPFVNEKLFSSAWLSPHAGVTRACPQLS